MEILGILTDDNGLNESSQFSTAVHTDHEDEIHWSSQKESMSLHLDFLAMTFKSAVNCYVQNSEKFSSAQMFTIIIIIIPFMCGTWLKLVRCAQLKRLQSDLGRRPYLCMVYGVRNIVYLLVPPTNYCQLSFYFFLENFSFVRIKECFFCYCRHGIRQIGSWLGFFHLIDSCIHHFWQFKLLKQFFRCITTVTSMEISIEPLLAGCPWWWRSNDNFFFYCGLLYLRRCDVVSFFRSSMRISNLESRSQYKISLLLPLSLVALLRRLRIFSLILTSLLSFIYWINGNNVSIWFKIDFPIQWHLRLSHWICSRFCFPSLLFFFFFFAIAALKRIEQLKNTVELPIYYFNSIKPLPRHDSIRFKRLTNIIFFSAVSIVNRQ